MSDDVQSIEDLLEEPSGLSINDDSAQNKFAKKQQEIRTKEMEKVTEGQASSMGIPYVNLFGFPISPEALSLISEEQSKTLKVVCFLYDGTNLRLGTTNPEQEEIKILLTIIKPSK